ncbi:MAG: RluA family pseudouridine synthase [Sphingobacteriales bacterium]|nr:MAG: RluA family pseudouridine synthase [Sphingobacteriales bacterium]TAF82559.1 MAG: RluA family pseudouridine synthase [Sphingobacteriales bacterium]
MDENDLYESETDLFEHYNIKVDKGQGLLRIDKFLILRVENASRNRIQNAIDAGNVLVNGKIIKASYRVKPADEISIVMPQPLRDDTVYPENIALNIIYEDKDVLLVNKSAGMVVHPGFGNWSGTLVNALAYHINTQLPQLPGNVNRPGLVHRIDKDTSGLLLISKNEIAMTYLAKQFYNHTITRKYIALVWGDLKTDGSVSGYIGRSAKDRRVMEVYNDAEKGKWSLTHYTVLERFNYVTLIACQLETGRTHQIRAHLKHIGHPLFADATYGGDKIRKGTIFAKYKTFVENCFNLMPRQALHALSLGFTHPTSKQNMYFETNLPSDFLAVINKWRSYIAYTDAI